MSDPTGFAPQDFLPFLLNRAAEESSLAFQKVYKDRYGLLRTEWRVLFHLGAYGRMSAREISDRAHIHKTKISRAVHKLAEKRYLSRNRDQTDRRSEHLTLTPSGEAVYRDLRAIADAYDQKLVENFTEEQTALLRGMLRQLAGWNEGL